MARPRRHGQSTGSNAAHQVSSASRKGASFADAIDVDGFLSSSSDEDSRGTTRHDGHADDSGVIVVSAHSAAQGIPSDATASGYTVQEVRRNPPVEASGSRPRRNRGGHGSRGAATTSAEAGHGDVTARPLDEQSARPTGSGQRTIQRAARALAEERIHNTYSLPAPTRNSHPTENIDQRVQEAHTTLGPPSTYTSPAAPSAWWQSIRQQVPSLQSLRHAFFPQHSVTMLPNEDEIGQADGTWQRSAMNRASNRLEEGTSHGDRSRRRVFNEPVPEKEDSMPPPPDVAPVQMGAEMTDMLAEMATGTFRGHDALGQLYEGDRGFNVATLPLYPLTFELRARGLKTPLHQHQLQGLLWMVQAEHRRHKAEKRAGLWHTTQVTPTRQVYRNVASRALSQDPPPLPRGGINADAMGLGKTLQVIALAISDKNRVPKGIPTRASRLDKGAEKEESQTHDESDSEESIASSYLSQNGSVGGNESQSSATESDSSFSSDTEDSQGSPPRKMLKRSASPHIKHSNVNGKGKSSVDESAGETLPCKGKGKGKARDQDKSERHFNNSTLVICPLSVLQNWTRQVQDHCDPELVKYLVYYSASAKIVRNKTNFAHVFGKYNFVFTTYDTVRHEYNIIDKRRKWELDLERKKVEREERQAQRRAKHEREKNREHSKSIDSDDEAAHAFMKEDLDMMPIELTQETPLFKTSWRRVVLDEAHIVRNPNTIIYRAICELISERRWAISGTPIVNSTRDLGALAAWIGLDPFKADDLSTWSRLIETPIARGGSFAEQAAGLLRTVVHSLCLRRHKGMTDVNGDAIVKLPDIQYFQHYIPLTASDRDFYDKCEMACRVIVQRWAERDSLQDHQGVILLFLLRLRQMSCHRRLIGSRLLEEIENTDWDKFDANASPADANFDLTPQKIEELQQRLRVFVEMGDDCPVCMEPLAERYPVITPCAHPFCRECIVAVIMNGQTSQRGPVCPMDRLPLPRTPSKLVELKTEESAQETIADDEVDDFRTSAKVRECLRIINGTLSTNATEKILVFSNFVRFLDIIADELEELGLPFARFHGSMNVQRRDDVLARFNETIQESHAASVRAGLRRYQQRQAAEKMATEAREAGSSKLLSTLQTLDWKASSTGPTKPKPARNGRRQKEIKDVVGDNPSILLISMGCGALGLNLTAASTVVLMDPWWQSTIEQQAIDRVHRIGQKRDIKVFQMICKDTVEDRVLQIQAEKERLAEQAFSGIRTNRGSVSDRRQKTQTSVRDLVRLFGIGQQDFRSSQSQRPAPQSVASTSRRGAA